MKRCSKCGKWLVASTVNFHRNKAGKYGLQSQCKECVKQYYEANKEKVDERHKQYYEANRNKISDYHKQWQGANKDKIAEHHKRYREANKDKIAERHKQYYENNKDRIAERHKQWCEDNPEYSKQYYQDNKDKKAEYNKRYYEANKDKILEQNKRYHQTPQGKVALFNAINKRRLKEQEQGSGITKDQWLEMMSFFNWRCAYSGETLTKGTRSIDHIVPLNSDGDNMVWNCVPMKLNYNSSKYDKDMLEWYKEQDFYSEARLVKIYEWQEYARKKWKK